MKALTLSNLICLVGMRNKPSSVRPPSRRDMNERASGLAILRLHAFKWSTRSSPKIGLIVVSWSIPREKSKKISRQIFIRFLPNFLACCATLLQKRSEAKTQNEKQGLVTSFSAVFLYGFFASDLFWSYAKVWKSSKKLHSTLQAKQVMVTFRVD